MTMHVLLILSIVSACLVFFVSSIPLFRLLSSADTLKNMVRVHLRALFCPALAISLVLPVVTLAAAGNQVHISAPFLAFISCMGVLDCMSSPTQAWGLHSVVEWMTMASRCSTTVEIWQNACSVLSKLAFYVAALLIFCFAFVVWSAAYVSKTSKPSTCSRECSDAPKWLGLATFILFIVQLVAYLVNTRSKRGCHLWISRVYVIVLALSAVVLGPFLVLAPALVPMVHMIVLLVRVCCCIHIRDADGHSGLRPFTRSTVLSLTKSAFAIPLVIPTHCRTTRTCAQ